MEEGITIKALSPWKTLVDATMLQSPAEQEANNLVCEVCGISFAEFREHQLLGCPNDYKAFEDVLAPMLEHAHEGASRHTGKVPADAAADERRQNDLLRLRGQLKDAVNQEDYEKAAALRDRIKDLEGS
jgi:protein arginine kinase activator